ncbi:hypothetical protein NIES4074_23640 [Cylindrospermum sp. NIES-4074]|nr:hypothetical protein NIES4074_23630 [Cylindrospermum sp. NIES-4074]BAZ29916.1 hypothetical protein NIES4074_23640 [Cylindrospermum sp. NIES-4074]
MKSIFKTAQIALLSVFVSAVAVNSSAQATTSISCKEQFVKEFTVIPYFTNTTRATIPAGTTINWKTYWAGQFTGNRQTVLSQPLASGASVSTGITFSGDNNSCTASF